MPIDAQETGHHYLPIEAADSTMTQETAVFKGRKSQRLRPATRSVHLLAGIPGIGCLR